MPGKGKGKGKGTPATALARRLAHRPPALVAQTLALLEAEIGGRDALVAALSHAPKSRDFALILGLVGDPMEVETPLADLCARGGVTVGELLQAYTAGEIARAQAVSTSKVGQQLAAVAEDTMRMSLPRPQLCMGCSGLGLITDEPTKKMPNPEPHPCQACAGTGQITVEGDLEHKKLALDMGRMLQKSGGSGLNLTVSQQVGVQVGSAGGALERLQAATDQILYGDLGAVEAPSGVVDGEVEGSPEVPEEATLDGDWRDEAPHP